MDSRESKPVSQKPDDDGDDDDDDDDVLMASWRVSDVDECYLRTANCNGADDVCINTRGGYKCQSVTCPRGFVKSPVVGNRSKLASLCT